MYNILGELKTKSVLQFINEDKNVLITKDNIVEPNEYINFTFKEDRSILLTKEELGIVRLLVELAKINLLPKRRIYILKKRKIIERVLIGRSDINFYLKCAYSEFESECIKPKAKLITDNLLHLKITVDHKILMAIYSILSKGYGGEKNIFITQKKNLYIKKKKRGVKLKK